MLKRKRIGAAICAIALLATFTVPALAGSDGWTNVYLPTVRGPKTLAIANHDSPDDNQQYASVYMSKCTAPMWLQVFQNSESYAVTPEYDPPCPPPRPIILAYNYYAPIGETYRLEGGCDNFWQTGYTSGTCYFH